MNLDRYLQAQELDYSRVKAELTSGFKQTHWIWYIFPQVKGLGSSEKAKFYALQTREELNEYIRHPILFPRLLECTNLVLNHSFLNLTEILPFPDNLKFISSMTAFHIGTANEGVFETALQAFNNGDMCIKTIDFLSESP